MLHQYNIKPTKQNKKMDKFLQLAQEELNHFFKIKMEQPFIFFIDSRQEIDKIWGKKTEGWLTGWVKQNNIFILNPNIYTCESDHKNIKHFWQTLKHEHCHLYYKQLTGINYPKWLNEGLACYLSGQIKSPPDKSEALTIFQYHQKTDWRVFKIGYFWVNLLLKRFGGKKMLMLLKSLNFNTTQQQFCMSFYKIYGFHFTKKDFELILDNNQKKGGGNT